MVADPVSRAAANPEREQRDNRKRPRPPSRTGNPRERPAHCDRLRGITEHDRPLRVDRVERVRIVANIGRRRRSHPMNAVVVPDCGVRARHPMPKRRRRGAGADCDRGHRRRARSRAIQIRRGRAHVLVEAARPDPEVRLAVVPEHDDVVVGAVGELQLVAEVDDVHGDTGDRGRDRAETREIVGRSWTRRGVGRGGRRADDHERERKGDESGDPHGGPASGSTDRRAYVHVITLPVSLPLPASGLDRAGSRPRRRIRQDTPLRCAVASEKREFLPPASASREAGRCPRPRGRHRGGRRGARVRGRDTRVRDA